MNAKPYFGERLRKRRRELDLTQAETAELIGMARQNYSPFEVGSKYPGDDYQAKLADILELPLLRLKSWIIIDKYGEEACKEVCKELKAL
jgi:transcriptional regulator with XRE-family HTH domain